MKKGICKLCHEEKELCKESHILPRFMYKFLAGENNEMVVVDREKAKRKFNSEYEGDILCKNCDSIVIGQLDDYGAKFLHGEFANKISARSETMDGRHVLVRENDPNYNYPKFKLFLLSLLWRSSISSRPFFGQIKLPAEIEEDLRQMILNGQPGDPTQYPCFIHLPPLIQHEGGAVGFNLFYMPTMSPIYLEQGELRASHFVIQGVHYYFIVTRPSTMNVLPAVERDKVTLAFATEEEQHKLIEQVLEHMKGHTKYRQDSVSQEPLV